MEKRLTVWEAACIVTGYSIGGGVMALPYLAARNGLPVALLILVAVYFISLLMHLMIADLTLRAGGGQILSVFVKFLVRGKNKKVWSIAAFVLVTVVLLTTLASHIAGAGEIIMEYLGCGPVAARFLFYILAASVVLFGLKALGISEKIAVTAIFVLLAVFAVGSIIHARNPLPIATGGWDEALAYYGMAMFSFMAVFSVPQAVEGLGGDEKKIKKALVLGFLNVAIMIVVITLCALLSSERITPLAMLGWSEGIGPWAQVLGALFTLLAILTTYWSISLALADTIQHQLKLNQKVCWLLATLPTLLMAFLGGGGFMEFMRLAGGMTAAVIALLIIPAFLGANKMEQPRLIGRLGRLPFLIAVAAAYILMMVGNWIDIR